MLYMTFTLRSYDYTSLSTEIALIKIFQNRKPHVVVMFAILQEKMHTFYNFLLTLT